MSVTDDVIGVVSLPETPATAQVPAVELPDAIQSAMLALVDAKQKLQSIRALIATASEQRNRSNRDYQAQFATLAEAEAGAVLEGTAVPQTLRKAVAQHQADLLTHDARLAGLQSREKAAVAEFEKATEELDAAHETWTRAEIDRAHDKFRQALQVFIDTVTTPVAVGLALADQRLTFVIKSAQIPSLADDARNGFDPLRFYRQNPAIVNAMEKYSGVSSAVNSALRAARQYVAAPQAAKGK